MGVETQYILVRDDEGVAYVCVFWKITINVRVWVWRVTVDLLRG